MDSYNSFQHLTIAFANGVASIAMEDSGHSNQELCRVFEMLSTDDSVRVVLLTGTAEKAFLVGAGGSAGRESDMDRNAYWIANFAAARDVVLKILQCDKPVIAKINGHAVGRGCSIALACDITLMAEEAKIGDPHVKVGLVAGDGGSLLWPMLVGLPLARRYLLTGDMLTGRRAADIGLITEAVPRAELDGLTDNWVERMASGASLAISLTKRALNMEICRFAANHMDASLGLETLTYFSADHAEGFAALAGKRPPVFKGK